MNRQPTISISVVSHGHGALVASLLDDLSRYVTTSHEIILTLNVPDESPPPGAPGGRAVRIRRNAAPRGFGANHNAAFREAQGEYFCVLNPDIRVTSDPFPPLLDCLRDPKVGVAAPLIRNPAGSVEDSARRFPTPRTILGKFLGARSVLDYAIADARFYPDWVAGMFMLLRSDVYASIGGFDERYFLYYEDVDLCARLARRGRRAVVDPSVTVVHDARRESRRNARYVGWHVSSMLRFFITSPGGPLARKRMTPTDNQ